jgi:DNA-binding transcriptional ArsR family regulator
MGDLDIRVDGGNVAGAEAADAVKAADFLRALANPHRLLILRLLRQSRHTVMELCHRLQLRQSLVSQHLARLRLDGVVTAERQGHYVIYSLSDLRTAKILDALADAIALQRAGMLPRAANGNQPYDDEHFAEA